MRKPENRCLLIERIRHVCTGVLGSANITGSLPISHCLDQTYRVGYQDHAERKRVGVLDENVSTREQL